MNNPKFHWLLSEPKTAAGKRKWTVERMAEAIYCGRASVTQALSNVPGRGGQTRRKLVKFFKKEFPGTWGEMIAALGWDEQGVPRGMSHVEQRLKVEG